MAQLDALLWTYEEASFLPHGTARDGNAARQPIWLTDRDENPNRATMLVLVDGAEAGDLAAFARCDMFDGNDADARSRRRASAGAAPSAAGHELTYWQQTGAGWERRA